jgi:hypothetical protein
MWDKKNIKTRVACLAVLAGLPFAAGCGQEDLPSCMEAVEYACGLCTQGLFYDLCLQEGQRDVCGLDCDFPDSFLKCETAAGDCDQAELCSEQYKDSLRGEVASSCEEFCRKCESCKNVFPEFSEGDCKDFSAAPDGECVTDCLGGAIESTLTRLARPISEFRCCQLDYLL